MGSNKSWRSYLIEGGFTLLMIFIITGAFFYGASSGHDDVSSGTAGNPNYEDQSEVKEKLLDAEVGDLLVFEDSGKVCVFTGLNSVGFWACCGKNGRPEFHSFSSYDSEEFFLVSQDNLILHGRMSSLFILQTYGSQD